MYSHDFKSLCAELVTELQGYKTANPMHDRSLLTRARAALSQPSADDDVEALKTALAATAAQRRAEDDARAALSQPQPPAGEVGELVAWLKGFYEYANELGRSDWGGMTTRAADLLERLAQPPQPIPVTERLPEAGDCDEDGKVWAWDVCADSWVLHPAKVIGSVALKARVTHWLPASALPLPSGEGEE